MTLVSVIIAAYNAAAHIHDAVNSVLAQTIQDFEIVIVDDGSTDSTAEVAAKYQSDPRIRYIYQSNRGPAQARNAGAMAAKGQYFAFLDADDSLAPTALEIMVGRFQESGASWSIVGVLKVQGEKTTVRHPTVPRGNLLAAILEDDFVTRNPFYPRNEFLAIGMYDEEIYGREDWDINIRMIAAGKPFVCIHEPLYIYVHTEGSITKGSRQRLCSNTEKLLRKHHKRIADAGSEPIARIYAKNMWDLARWYFYEIGDYREGLRCAIQSLRYDLSLKRLFHPLIHHSEVALGRRPQA
jgi:glycosyltransferase involved in cell wall biosynthesis